MTHGGDMVASGACRCRVLDDQTALRAYVDSLSRTGVSLVEEAAQDTVELSVRKMFGQGRHPRPQAVC